MPEPTTRPGHTSRGNRIPEIPPLKNLMYALTGYTVPAAFATRFVDLHHHDWDAAEDHWERAVREVLDTDAVEPRATGDSAVRQAVAATAEFLTTGAYFPWCPWCRRGIRIPSEEATG